MIKKGESQNHNNAILDYGTISVSDSGNVKLSANVQDTNQNH